MFSVAKSQTNPVFDTSIILTTITSLNWKEEIGNEKEISKKCIRLRSENLMRKIFSSGHSPLIFRLED